jgi:hypothetical protein
VAQARTGNQISTTPIPAGQLQVIGEGRQLEPRIRQTMESFFQANFSEVRVHEGPAAQGLGALAFTMGENLHFAPGLYDPTRLEGVELLAHELTHVVQQREGRVANPYRSGVAIVQDPGLETEADSMGRWIAEEIGSRSGVAQPSKKAETYPQTTDWAKQMPINKRYNLSDDDWKWLKIAHSLRLACPVFGHASGNPNSSQGKANDAKSKFSSFMRRHCAKKYKYNSPKRGHGEVEMPLNKAWSEARDDVNTDASNFRWS